MSRNILVVAESSAQFQGLYLPFKEEYIKRGHYQTSVSFYDGNLSVYWYQKRNTLTDQMLDLKYDSVIWMCDKPPSKLEQIYISLLCESYIYFLDKEDI